MSLAKRYILSLLCGVTLIIAAAPDSARASWLSAEWQERIPFSVAEGAVPIGTTLSDFTMVLQLDGTDFASVFALADSVGEFLAITAADGETLLDHEVVSYDRVTETAEIWFRADALSELENEFFLYYHFAIPVGEEPAALLGAGSPWTPDYLAVYHFSEDPSQGVLKDWGPNGTDGVPAVKFNPVGPGWTSANQVSGVVGSGWEFDGAELYAYAENVASADSSFTVTAWFANSQLVDKGALCFQAVDGGWNTSFQRTLGHPNGDVDTPDGSMSWLPEVLDGDMHAFTWVMDAEADTIRFYLDGVEQDYWLRYTPPGEPGPVWSGGTVDGRIGIIGPAWYNNLDVADGVADEFRLIEGLRSSEWIATEYLNQSDPAAFFVVGAPEQRPLAAGDPLAGISSLGKVTVSPNPFRGVARVSVETSQDDLTVQVFDVRGRLVKTLGRPTEGSDTMLRYVWDGRDEGGTSVSNGIYYIRAQSGGAVATGKALRVR